MPANPFFFAMQLLACLAASVAFAAPSEMEELIVASRLRDSRALDVPVSISVLDSRVIDEVAVQHFEELTPLVPNLNWSGEGRRARYFQIRGIGELEQYEGAPNPSVGFIIDDIDVSAIGGAATSFDMQQFEVLRGPQGTRYGANALAGLIYARSAEPSETPEARLEGTAGSDDVWALGGAAGGPFPWLEDQLQYRVAAQSFRGNGFRDNEFLGRDDTYEHEEFTGRAKLRWKPDDDWQFDLAGLYVDLDNGYDGFAIDNGFTTYSDKPGRDAQQTLAGSLRITGTPVDGFEVISITSVADSEFEFSFDADWGNDEFWAPYIYDFFQSFPRERDTLSQEFRLVSMPGGRLFAGSTDWAIGAYWLSLDESLNRTDVGRDDFFCPVTCITSFASEYDADNLAFFGEIEAELSSGLSLTAGLRWEQRDADYQDSNGRQFAPTDSMVGGDVSLIYALDENARLYGRVARGYKAGGFNLDPNVDPADIEFAPEYLWNYEIGLKTGDPDGRWIVDLSLFYQDRDDLQVKIPVQDELGNPIAFSFFTENAERGSNYGLEFAGQWFVADSVQLHGALGLLRTDIDRFSYAPLIEGRDQAHAPRYSFAFGATWYAPRDWFARVDVTGKDEFFFDYGHDAKSQAYELVNLRVGKAWAQWSVDLWVKNVLDEEYAVRGFFFGNEPPDFPEKTYVRLGDPRHYGITLRYRYR